MEANSNKTLSINEKNELYNITITNPSFESVIFKMKPTTKFGNLFQHYQKKFNIEGKK